MTDADRAKQALSELEQSSITYGRWLRQGKPGGHMANLVGLLGQIAGGQPAPTPSPTPTPTPTGLRGIYAGAYIDGWTMGQHYGPAYANTVPWDPNAVTQARFEQDAGKSLAVIFFGTGAAPQPFWASNADQMVGRFQEANRRGCYPMLDASTGSVPLGDIAAGKYDTQISGWLGKFAAYGKPWMWRLNCEMNGDWYPHGRVPGQGASQPENFVASWKHIWSIADSLGVNRNLSWHWAPNSISPWNDGTGNQYDHYEEYWPGAQFVDWTNLICYQQSKDQSAGDWWYLSGPSYRRNLGLAPNLPMAVTEWSSFYEFTQPPKPGAGTDANKGDWLQHALEHMRDHQPAIRMSLIFNTGYDVGKQEHNEIQTSPAATAGYRAGVADPVFLGKQTLATSGKVPVPTR